jgi:hypothetical protein
MEQQQQMSDEKLTSIKPRAQDNATPDGGQGFWADLGRNGLISVRVI